MGKQSKEYIRAYQRAYGIKNRQKRKMLRGGIGRSTSDIYIVQEEDEVKLLLNEHYFVPDSVIDVCCSSFGCGRLLSYQEKLFGNKCISCSGK